MNQRLNWVPVKIWEYQKMMPYISDGKDLPAYYFFNGTKMLMFDYNKANKFTATGYTSYYGEPSKEYIDMEVQRHLGYGSPEYRPMVDQNMAHRNICLMVMVDQEYGPEISK